MLKLFTAYTQFVRATNTLCNLINPVIHAILKLTLLYGNFWERRKKYAALQCKSSMRSLTPGGPAWSV